MQVAAQHAKAVGQRSRISMEERLLLDRIALHAAHITPRDIESAAAVISNFANSGLAVGNRTAMAAGVTANAIAVKLLVKLACAFANVLVYDIAQSGHYHLTPNSKPRVVSPWDSQRNLGWPSDVGGSSRSPAPGRQ